MCNPVIVCSVHPWLTADLQICPNLHKKRLWPAAIQLHSNITLPVSIPQIMWKVVPKLLSAVYKEILILHESFWFTGNWWCSRLFFFFFFFYRISNFTTLLLGVFHTLYLLLSSPWHIFLQGLREKLRLIYGSRCVVIPIGNVCVMASLLALSEQMRIQRSRRPVWTLCRQAPAGSAKPPFNPCRFVTSIGSSH